MGGIFTQYNRSEVVKKIVNKYLLGHILNIYYFKWVVGENMIHKFCSKSAIKEINDSRFTQT